MDVTGSARDARGLPTMMPGRGPRLPVRPADAGPLAPRPAPPARRLGVAPRAFTSPVEAPRAADEPFPEPLEYAALLGLQGREAALQDSQIISAFEELSATPLEDGYSPKVGEGRGALLHAAVDGVRRLRGLSLRPEQGGLATQEARVALVQWWLFPAALSLLQETGQPELVLDYGSVALALRESAPFRRDILLAMALAHCALSGEAFADREKVGLGCARLEEAGALLAAAGLGAANSRLAAEVQQGLRELKPQCLLEHLKVPPGQGGARHRRQAVAVLKSLLAAPERAAKADGTTGVDRKFVRSAFGLLASGETVELLDWPDLLAHRQAVPWYFDDLLERGVMAHIVAGFTARSPATVEEGLGLLRGRFHSDLLLLGVVSYVLLADPQAACRLLLEAESRGYFRREAARAGGSPRGGGGGGGGEEERALPAKGDTLAFIRAHSPEGDADLMPGVCLFAERWLSQVALPRFVDTGAAYVTASLAPYFETQEVTRYLSARRQARGPLPPLSVPLLRARLGRRWRRAAAQPLSTRNAHRHKVTELPRLPLPEGSVSVLHRQQQQQQQQRGAAVSLPRGSSRVTPPAHNAAGLLLIAATGLAAVLAPRRAAELEPAPAPVQLAAPTQAPAADPAAPAAAARGWAWRAPWQNDAAAAAEHLTPRAAEACIRRWQVAKAAAMGPRHDEGLLGQALAEPYLGAVRRDAASARKAGWFWSYQLSRLHVEGVDCSGLGEAGDGEAVATARLRERGELFAVTGKRADAHCFDNAFAVEYGLRRAGPDGGWRICRVLVLGDDA